MSQILRDTMDKKEMVPKLWEFILVYLGVYVCVMDINQIVVTFW